MKKKPLMEREELNHAGIEVRIKIAHLKQNKAKAQENLFLLKEGIIIFLNYYKKILL